MMHLKVKKSLIIFITVLWVVSAFSFRQTTGAITGTVKDARSKQPIIEAVITLSSTAFKGQKFALTDSTGMYRITNLPAGNYTVSFEMEGYEKFVRENISLEDGGSIGVSYEMVKEGKRKRKVK